MAEVSDREAEVLEALGAHLTNAQIAGRLHISVRTVESHVSSLLRKYGVPDRRALAGLAAAAEPSGAVRGIPAARTSFVGRAGEREAVLAGFDGSRLVTLLGPGGVGKTRLAAEVASVLPYGGAFVELVPVRDGFVAQAVAAAFGVAERSEQPLEDAIAERLGKRHTLVVLDNCEHVLDAVAAFADRLLSDCPGVRILATSRERLGIPGERIVPVTPLPLASDAERLFLDRARDADPGFEAPAGVIGEICARLDGVPLAIELAAARSGTLGADGLLAALDDSLRLLSGGRGAAERHRSLGAVLGWSYDLLDEEERAFFRRLSVFVGGFDLDAVTAVAADGDRLAAVDVLARLTGKSLVVRTGSRWRLLETVRAFALDRLTDGDDSEPAQTRARYLRWAADTASALRDRLGGEWRDDFDAVVDDLRAALTLAAPEPAATAHRLARGLGRLAYARRFLKEARERYLQAAELAPDPAGAAEDLRSAADIAVATAAAGTAYELLLAAADKAEGNARAAALAQAVVVATRHPGFGFDKPAGPDRLAVLEKQANEAADPHDPTVTAHLAAAAAWTADCGNPALAKAAVEAARAAGDPVLITGALDAQLSTAARNGHLRQAHALARERLDLLPELDRGDPRAAIEIVDTYHSASTYAIAVGDIAEALAVARMVLADDLVGSHMAIALTKFIPPLVLAGQFEEALSHAGAMWESRARAGSRPGSWLTFSLAALSLAQGLRDDEEQSRLWRDRATGLGASATSRELGPFLAFVDARLAVHTGRHEDAAALVERAFADFVPGRFDRYARAAGAELAVAAGLPDAPARLEAAADDAHDNDWAAACLLRARARLTGDPALLESSAATWSRIGATFEHAVTRSLIS
ncbi:ATP-binding protein [Nonomuraea sp. NPDC050536]|uniref:ATP-binding protein n=1 Tax=Nonomuraea sp. NPDC050536 TaxID=3364366 RepID=UPI0037C76736